MNLLMRSHSSGSFIRLQTFPPPANARLLHATDEPIYMPRAIGSAQTNNTRSLAGHPITNSKPSRRRQRRLFARSP